ncbi:MAG: sigma-70 family RNA polymerase sigma factor [Clostridium sp.]
MENIDNVNIKKIEFDEYEEEHLIKAAIKGDKNCFSKVIKNNKIYLYRTAYSYVKNEDDALEILQECTYRALINISKLKNHRYFRTWITRIIINCAIDFVNKKNILTEYNDEVAIDDKNLLLDEKMDLYNAIDRLRDSYKTVIILKYFNDMSVQDMSEVMRIPENTVKTYLKRARKSLGSILKEGYIYE